MAKQIDEHYVSDKHRTDRDDNQTAKIDILDHWSALLYVHTQILWSFSYGSDDLNRPHFKFPLKIILVKDQKNWKSLSHLIIIRISRESVKNTVLLYFFYEN